MKVSKRLMMEEDPTTLAFTRSARKRTLVRGRNKEENGEKGERGKGECIKSWLS